MAAYDQVLAKLGSVSSPTLADAADLDLKTRGKRKASTSADEKDSRVSVATPPVKTRNKKSKSSGASTGHVAATPIMHKAAAAEAEAKLHDTSSNSVAATVLPSTDEKTAAAKASHLARFGRRRAGKSVRRCLHHLSPLQYMSILHRLSSGACSPVLVVSTLVPSRAVDRMTTGQQVQPTWR